MASLHELVQTAHKLARERVSGKAVDYIELHHPAEYCRDSDIHIEVVACFDRDHQNLEEISVEVTDNKVSRTFTREELQRLVSFIDDPSELSISAKRDEEDLSLKYEFELYMKRFSFIMRTKWKSQEEGYSELVAMFGLKTGKGRTTYTTKGIDTSKIPGAYDWIWSRGLAPHIHILGDGARTLHLRRNVHSCDTKERTNTFTLEDSQFIMSPKQVDAIESQIKAYKGTDLTQMPFNIERFDLVTDQRVIPNLRTVIKKERGIGDKIMNLLAWVLKIPESHPIYEDLEVTPYKH